MGILATAQVQKPERACTKAIWSGLCRSQLIPILARQAAVFNVLKSLKSGGVTVYEPQKTAVYRQKYRHKS